MVKQVLVILILLSLFSCKNKPAELTQVSSAEKISISPYKGGLDSVALNIPIEVHIAFHKNKIKYLALRSYFERNRQEFPRESYILDKKTKKIYFHDKTTEDYDVRADEDLIFYKRDFPISNTEAKALLAHTKYKDLDLRTLEDTLMLKPMKQLRADCPNCFNRIDTIDYIIKLDYDRKPGGVTIPQIKVDWKL